MDNGPVRVPISIVSTTFSSLKRKYIFGVSFKRAISCNLLILANKTNTDTAKIQILVALGT